MKTRRVISVKITREEEEAIKKSLIYHVSNREFARALRFWMHEGLARDQARGHRGHGKNLKFPISWETFGSLQAPF
jgi:hypothetical protein